MFEFYGALFKSAELQYYVAR